MNFNFKVDFGREKLASLFFAEKSKGACACAWWCVHCIGATPLSVEVGGQLGVTDDGRTC